MFNRQAVDMPPALPGFDGITRYYDKSQKCFAAKIKPGEFYVSKTNELIVTVLGSCVAACVRDPVNLVGGMNHFMLPTDSNVHNSLDISSDAARYGNFAMEFLVNNVIRNGGERRYLEVKLFGGCKVLKQLSRVGEKNIDFIEQYVKSEALKVIAKDLGGAHPRKVVFDPVNGMVRVKKLRSLHNETIVQRESSYMHQLETQQESSGDIELFD